MFKAFIFAAVIPALAVLAEVTPSEPAPGNVYNEGSNCTIEWDKDTTGQWSTMNIELMTGSNSAMVHLTTVATVDGTTITSYSYTCPSVSPNSAIYFYQFSTPTSPTNLTWTGRFAIADASGNTVDPTDTDSNGIKFGTGALADPSTASSAPPYLNGAVATTSANASANASASGASSSGSVAPSTTVQTSATGALTATGSLTTSVRSTAATSGRASGSSSSTSSAASSSTSSSSGASALVLNFKARGLQALVGLAGTAFVFATML